MDSAPIAEATLDALTDRHSDAIAGVRRQQPALSHFEVLTGLALRHFADQKVGLFMGCSAIFARGFAAMFTAGVVSRSQTAVVDSTLCLPCVLWPKLLGLHQVDIAVVEAGLGGERDATNVFTAEELKVAIFTAVGMEHAAALGMLGCDKYAGRS